VKPRSCKTVNILYVLFDLGQILVLHNRDTYTIYFIQFFISILSIFSLLFHAHSVTIVLSHMG
jgi:hypothetical protein